MAQQQLNGTDKVIEISMVIRMFYPHLTGVVVQYRQLGAELRKMGVHLSVHTSSTDQAPEPFEYIDGISIYRYPVEGVPVNQLIPNLLKQAQASWAATNSLPEAVLFIEAGTNSLRQLWQLRKQGVRLALAVTIFPEPDSQSLWQTVKGKIRDFIIMNLFDAILVYSSTFVRLYAKSGVARSRLFVLPFPVDCQKFLPPSQEEKTVLREKLGLPDTIPLVLFMGVVCERKGAELLLEAWLLLQEKYPDAKLVYVGPYGNRETMQLEKSRIAHAKFLENFQGMLDKLINPNSVLLTGAVNNPEDYFRAVDVFAFPSRLEGMGGVIPEAMACGLPSVLTPFEGFPEVEFGKEGDEFLMAEFTGKSIADAISHLLDSPSERQRMGQNARRHALRVFDLPMIARKFAQTFGAS